MASGSMLSAELAYYQQQFQGLQGSSNQMGLLGSAFGGGFPQQMQQAIPRYDPRSNWPNNVHCLEIDTPKPKRFIETLREEIHTWHGKLRT